MAYTFFNIFREKVMTGEIDFNTDDIKCMLVSNLYTFNADDHLKYTNVAEWEVGATGGYTAGGKALTGVTVFRDLSSDRALVRANEVCWVDSTITASGAILYRGHPDPTQSWLIVYHEFNTSKSSRNNDFVVWFSDLVILT
jgi:hypothetical protein